MANNYLLFSEVILDLTKQEQAWLAQVLDKDKVPAKIEAQLCGGMHDVGNWGWPYFQYAFEDKNKTLWLYTEENGDLEILGNIVREFLAKFRPDDSFTLSYAVTCSKPRVGEFGGGAIFVTARNVEFTNAWEWQEQKKMAFNKALEKKHGPTK